MVNKSGKSFKLRQNASQSSTRKEPKNNNKKVAKVQSKKTEKEANNLVYPGGDTAFKAILSARFCAAIWSHITDCDETFNYWEPTHYLVFGKGLQTWEYSPQFALRSYTYLLVHAIPAYIYHKILQPNPLLIFYFIRCLLGLACSFAEVYFYKAVCREFGVHVGRLCLAFQLFSAGMFISSTAYLPSSYAMYTFAAACAAWWQQKYPLAIFFTALGSLLGWPFAALLGVPIAFDMLYCQKMYKDFIQWSVISAVTVLGPMVAIDSKYFGKLTIAPWNIVKYNVLGGAGPELYGKEPFSFYIVNGFLNFNFVWVLALLSPVVLALSHILVPARNRATLMLPHTLSLAPMFLWLVVFLFQSHKEERFLFPIYPMICLAGAISVDVVQKLIFRLLCLLSTKRIGFIKISPSSHYLDSTAFVMFAAVTICSLIGISRIFSLYKNYHAPLDLTMELNRFPLEGKFPNESQVNVCLGKDWYRFPGSFFLPNTNWNVRFIKSEFDGMLPAPYTESENGKRIQLGA
ncbi:alpha-1,2-mannosyltransferase ALG9-like isoform X2 [Agrilus planipennis]|uniref:Mannosyltransferase n=1 Tax=Agrilus planipennis TaxID=224129 RepID=A0A1W4W5U9_AGRPL|nr:alpha-1,2-mannosyltransferase ALG9 isoform X3 [Agrilus planipennis]XP_025836255.1 alpha-1,2-mannosyltransferase ALG9 isoform X4 [Agrilus planipennis]XP_025836266.1 alpha-1,2-mannosyltransferase ALG9-like isoform X2 [Agrilus planipennis]